MKHDYTDEEIKEAENEAFRRKPIAKGHEWVKAFLDALPERPQPWPVVVKEPPQDEEQPDLSGENEKQSEPVTFEAHGKTWTRHTPGDPMPCDGGRKVYWLLESEFKGKIPYSAINAPARALFWTDVVGWRYADEPAQPEPAQPWTPAVGDVVCSIPEMALGGQMYWRDLALQIARVWWKCHNIGASLQHGDLDKDIAFSIVCERHGGRVFHGDTPENAWHKAEEWLLSPDRENFPAACLTPSRP